MCCLKASIVFIFLVSKFLHNRVACALFEDGTLQSEVSYTNYKLLRTATIPNSKVLQSLKFALEENDQIQLWAHLRLNQRSNILISPAEYAKVKDLFAYHGLGHELLQDNIQGLIDHEKAVERMIALSRQSTPYKMEWTSYHSYKDIYDYCKYLASGNFKSASGAVVTTEDLGKSAEKRNLLLVKVTSSDGKPKPAIWIDGCAHAREWISPATVTYILNVLVTDKRRGQQLLDAFDWYFIPVLNIDGYEFSRTWNRMWRKNRARTRLSCIGIDLNRNYAYKWGGKDSSNNPCRETYRGSKAFSEIETKLVSDAILARASDIKLYLTFHSHGQMLLVPWGGETKKPDDYQDLLSLGNIGIKALEATYGTKYKIGTAPDLLYASAGGSDDWAKSRAGIKYAYTFELRDTGDWGFLLPPEQIIPSGNETFNAVSAMALALKRIL